MTRYKLSDDIRITSSDVGRRSSYSFQSQQRGVVLFIALIILVAMSLATIALVRSVDTGTLVAGNLGFKQSAVQSGDRGSEEAIKWLEDNNGSILDTDNSANGYYATRQDSVDLTGNRTTTPAVQVDWEGTDSVRPIKAKKVAGVDAAGNQVAYIIHRLCTNAVSPGDPSNLCSVATIKNPTSSLSTPDYQSYGLKDDTLVYYRITTRISGPKNTVTFVQTFVAM